MEYAMGASAHSQAVEGKWIGDLVFWRGAVRTKGNGPHFRVGQRAEGVDNPKAYPGILKIDGAYGKRRLDLRLVIEVLGLDGADSAVSALTFRHGGHGVQVVCHGNDGEQQKRQSEQCQVSL